MSLFVTNAYAAGDAAVQATTGAAGAAATHAGQQPGSILNSVILIVVFIGFFYFLFIRPQNKRAKDHRNLLSSLNKGDEIVTGGGLMGKINELSEDQVDVEVAPGVVIKVQRSAIVNILPKGTIKSL